MNDVEPVRFVTRRIVEQVDSREGPRVHVTEHWNDGHTTQRVMGPRETVAWLKAAGR